MSANSGDLKKGLKVLHDGKEKTVRDWYFVSVSSGNPHNSDEIVIQFTDGTDTGDECWSKIKYLHK